MFKSFGGLILRSVRNPHDCPSDRFRDRRHDGVSDGANSVHPIGRPIKNSNCSGVISRPPKASTKRRQLGHFCIDGATKFALRVGVCNNPPTVSLMVSPCVSA
jgi:hypothetical protein